MHVFLMHAAEYEGTLSWNSHLCLHDAVGRMPSAGVAASPARCCTLNRHLFLSAGPLFLSAGPLLVVVAFCCNSSLSLAWQMV